MKQKVNIQGDVASRTRISEKAVPTQAEVVIPIVEPVTNTEDAESEAIPEPTADETTREPDTPKKRGRAAKRNI